MKTFIWISIFLAAFSFMEFMAWFTHKYIMHGFLWNLHRDHHKKDHGSKFERNDAFFVFYALIGMLLFWLGSQTSFWYGWPLGSGITAYGATYFLVHDIFIHQRFKLFKNTHNRYIKGIRRAHKMHHKHLDRENGECFGMLAVPFIYFRKSKLKS